MPAGLSAGRRRTGRLGPLLACAVLAACAAPGVATLPNPYPPPPLAPVETMPKPPVSATPLVWQPGHYEWTGAGYVWYAGLYVQQQGQGTLWQPGYWGVNGGNWVWRPAHWAAPGQV